MKSAGDQDLPLHVRRGVGKVGEGRVGAERLAVDEGGRHAATLRRCGSRQHLRRKDEEPIGIADGRGQDAQASQHGRGIVGAVVGVEHARSRECLGAAPALRHFEHELAFGGDGHCNREPASAYQVLR